MAEKHHYDFAFIVAKELLKGIDGNFVFSPGGLCRILEMLQAGMDENGAIYERVSVLIEGVNSRIEPVDGDGFKLEHASSIWYNKLLGSVNEGYTDRLENDYGAEVCHADFAQRTLVRLMIDRWVSDNTHHMIKSLDSGISKDALMLVLDAVYVKGKWEYPFDPDETELDMFYNADGSESEVDMMFQNIEEVEYAETDCCQLISLPYRNGVYSMVLVLPKVGEDIENVMVGTDWICQSTGVCEVNLYMPRFRFDNTLSYGDTLSALGLGDMFGREDSFPKVSDESVHVSQIVQQCVIDVDEEGTEAAAITVAVLEAGCPPTDDFTEPVTMRLNRPFGFAIKGEFDELLFMGVVRDLVV